MVLRLRLCPIVKTIVAGSLPAHRAHGGRVIVTMVKALCGHTFHRREKRIARPIAFERPRAANTAWFFLFHIIRRMLRCRGIGTPPTQHVYPSRMR